MRAAWFAPSFLLLAVLAGAAVARRGPSWLFGLVLVLLVIPCVWVLISALLPARAERTCPRCGAERLARTDRRSTVGLVCRGCGWRDDSASAWLLAEEEGPLEDIVLAERGRRRRSPVDSPTKPD